MRARQVALVPGTGPLQEPILSVLCKWTYGLTPEATAKRTEEGVPLHEEDIGFDGPAAGQGVNKHESDLIAYKPLTDIILHGCAWAPKGKTATFIDVGVSVGPRTHRFRVFGDRTVNVTAFGFEFTEPDGFEFMRLDCSRAYGGVDRKSRPGQPLPYPRNPAGKGFVVGANPGILQDLALPNLEDPEALLTPANLVMGRYENWINAPAPVFFGLVPRSSYPRSLQSGPSRLDYLAAEADRQVDAAGLAEIGVVDGPPRASLPASGNPEYHNGAPPGMKVPTLGGGETITLHNLDPGHPEFRFQLDPKKPVLWLDVGNGKQFLESVPQTLEIYKETNQCTVTWRGMARYGGLQNLRKFPRLAFGVE